MFFILLLISTVICISIYIRSSQDIFGVLGVGMTIACLIWGLTIAHWSLHLLALLALFGFRKQFILASTMWTGK